MKKEFLMCLAAVLLTAGVASAVVWSPTDPNDIAAGYSNWNKAANWGGTLPDVQGTATFNNKKIDCWVTGVQNVPTKFAMGDGGNNGNNIFIKNGGSLSIAATNDWAAVGYSRAATMTIEKGGKVTHAGRFMVGRAGLATVANAPSKLIVDGGTFEITGTNKSLQMGESTAWSQLIVKNGGLVSIKASGYITQAVAASNMLIDIGFGKIITSGDRRGNYDTWKASTPPELVAFGGNPKAQLVYDFNVTNPGMTTLTAIHPMAPSPAYDSRTVVPSGPTAPINLGWTNMDPNFPGQTVYVDVWFGTEPNKLNPAAYTKVVTAQSASTVQVNAPAVGGLQKYYWQVDSYIYGTPTGTPIAGDVFVFSTTDDAPPTVVIDTPNMVTWYNQPVQLNATVTDVGSSAVTVAWTSSDPNAVFTPSAAAEDPTVTLTPATTPKTYTLTCSVKDGFNPTVTNTDTVQVIVYANACLAARRPNAPGVPTSDIDGDCDTQLDDLFSLLGDWTTDYTILVPTVIP
jgi:hypothetical protein